MMKSSSLLFFFFLAASAVFSQKNKIDWDLIKAKNSYKSGADSILVMKTIIAIEEKDTEYRTIAVNFISINPPVAYYATDYPGWKSVTKYVNGDLYSKRGLDSEFVYIGHHIIFDPSKNIYKSPAFDYVDFTPLFNKKFYKGVVTVNSENKSDELVITQLELPDKSFKRILHLKNMIIYRVETLPAKKVDVYNHWITDYEFIKDKSFDSVCKELHIGLYTSPDSARAEQARRDSLKSHKPLTLPLINRPGITPSYSPGKYYILDFWYIGCRPCVMIIPDLESIQNLIDSNKVLLFGINPYNKNHEVLNFCKKYNIDYPQVNGSVNPLSYYKIDAFPTILVFDSEFNVVKSFEGYSPSIKKEILKYLKEKDLLKK